MAMLELFTGISKFFRVRNLIDHAVIDNVAFRLHYRFTSAILFASSLLVTTSYLSENSIECLSEERSSALRTYCWITSTFILPKMNDNLGNEYDKGGEEKRYQSYYQWVPFVLFFQAVLFYIPHWLWKYWESGKVQIISENMRGIITDSKIERRTRTQNLAKYIYETLHLHNTYAAVYFFCEVLNFVNVVTNILLMNSFLGGNFLNYGSDWLAFINADPDERDDPMIKIFPRLTKCTFHKYGPSGTIEKRDALCVLAVNIINEKIYLFIWFWFLVLVVTSGVILIYRAIIILVPIFREFLLHSRFKFRNKLGTKTLVKNTQIGDFLLLHFLGKNMNVVYFNELLEELHHYLQIDSSNRNSIELFSIENFSNKND